jgi:ribosomal protein S6--L-glutamate ligase
MKLFFILESKRGSEVPGPVLSEVFEELAQRGFDIESGKVEETLLRSDLLKPTHDLYLLKSDTELSLSMAGILHSHGARLLNPYPSCIKIRDKILSSNVLRTAGIPTPPSWITQDLILLLPLVEKWPLIIKPYRGFHGRDIHIIRTLKDLANLTPLNEPALNEPVLVQKYVEGNGEDLKVYVIGKDVFATRKPFHPDSFRQPGQLCPVSTEVRDIALRCGEIFGLGLYGLDIIEGSKGPIVVDLNYFPGYKGVPNASSLLADYIEKYALGGRSSKGVDKQVSSKCDNMLKDF